MRPIQRFLHWLLGVYPAKSEWYENLLYRHLGRVSDNWLRERRSTAEYDPEAFSK